MRCLCLLGFIFLLLIFTIQDGQAFLKTQGKNIVDSNGQKILLRGIGLGGWLVPEGYMLHIPGYGSPTSIRNMILELIGPDYTEEFYQRYRSNYVTEEDIRQIASWGFNSIRLPFNYRLLTPEDQVGIYLEEGFQIIDQLLEWCEAYHLYLILDMHCAPGGQNKDNISDSNGSEARLWTNVVNQDRTVEIWRKIAERYADKEWIGGYDLINEPVLPAGYSNTDLRLLYMRITQAIREVDANHIIFIEGNWYATDFHSLTPPFDVNLVYSFHKYWNENTQSSIQSYLNIRNLYKVPLWLGESGENSNPWFSDCVQLMEKNDIGWCWWTHKKIETLTSPYSSPILPNYQRVLVYWNGRAGKPTVEFAKDALFEMADNLLLDKCEFRPGVLDALLRSDYGSKSALFKEHHIPGMIHCSDYDFGNVNVAYFDTDYQKVSGPTSGEQWNIGWKYRNDGVDIELSADADGAEYNVGWIATGEWLKFTVLVDESGQYDIDFRVASPNNNGKLRLLMDNQPLTNAVSIPNTGGWKNWHTITVSNVSIPDGEHSLKLLFLEGGFNINFIRFNLKQVFIEESHLFEPITDNVLVAQNYPNPFNNITQIPILLLQPNNVTLTIYNSQGAFVKTLFNGLLPTGLEIISWNGTDDFNYQMSSGTYFCQCSVDGSQKVNSMILQK